MKEQPYSQNYTKNLMAAGVAIMWLSHNVRLEGLLWLDLAKESETITRLVCCEELSRMIDLVVNGTEPEQIEDLCMKRYYSQDYSGQEGYLYLLYLDSMLSIQGGDNPALIEESLKSYMPSEITPDLIKAKADIEKNDLEKSEADWEKLLGREFPIENTRKEYGIITLVDRILTEMSDAEIQRLLRDIDNRDDATLMKGLSGKALQRIHDNLSPRLAAMLLEDYDFSGPINIHQIGDVATKVLRIMLSLEEHGELSVTEKFNSIIGDRIDRSSSENQQS